MSVLFPLTYKMATHNEDVAMWESAEKFVDKEVVIEKDDGSVVSGRVIHTCSSRDINTNEQGIGFLIRRGTNPAYCYDIPICAALKSIKIVEA